MSGGTSHSYSKEQERCERFLTNYHTKKTLPDGSTTLSAKYMEFLEEVAKRTRKVVEIELDDIIQYDSGWKDLVHQIESNSLRFVSIFCSAIDKILTTRFGEVYETTNDTNNANYKSDVLDVLWMHRQQRQLQTNLLNPENQNNQDILSLNSFPEELRRRYELHLIPRAAQGNSPFPFANQVSIRDVKATHIGKLVAVKGIVTRITEVKPLITVATYTCDTCGVEVYQEVTSRTFNPLIQCPNPSCNTTGKGSRSGPGVGILSLQTRGSKFVKFQEVRIQELSEQVPIGHIPRSITIQVKGELTRSCVPGDIVTVVGIFLPTPHSSAKIGNKYKGGLLADTFIQAMKIIKFKKSYASYTLTPQLAEDVNRIGQEGDAYGKLARSLAPEIYGHTDVKKALLLLMVGGVSRSIMSDAMKIRGDINVCLMGDPGVAKSQLLKHISTIAPRGIYTSGKGSSGVGLTAAVLRDPVTGDLVLEGGSLVLADKGICCIDEFDKMDESDRTAIHEVMEQQTISIAKAGITTSLNARTSILAAANPAFGRYNTKRSPWENINLPAALLSRFDLLFVLLDKPDMDSDMALAEHVTYVHKYGCHPPLETEVFSPEFIRAFISQARRQNPYVPRELTDYIVSAYTNMRKEEAESAVEFTYTTARTLLGILRLSTALARVRFDNVVRQGDVDEAMRLMHESKASLVEDKMKNSGIDPVSDIFRIIRTMASSSMAVIPCSEILPRVVAKGYTEQQLDECLREYENLGVWQVNNDRSQLKFVLQ